MSSTVATAPESGSSSSKRGWITVSIMLATIMQALDTTIANVALPNMKGSMSATEEQISWVLTSYIVAAAIATPLTGFLSAKLGRKRLFLLSVTGFTIASLLCGIAANLEEMVLFRLLQGVFGAGLVPLSQAVLLDTYPKEQHGSAMAMWGVGVMVGPILGPTLGGYLTEMINWRWVFFINLPFGILSLLGILFFVPETEKEKRRFDLFGFALLGLAIGALQLLLDRGQSLDWFSSLEIQIEALIAGTALLMFLVHMHTHREPFLEPGLFRDRNLAIGLMFIFMVGIILLATLALLPPFLQNLMSYPVITTGLVLAPRGLGSMVAMMLVGRLVNRVDVRLLILTGLILLTISLFEMANFNTQVSSFTVGMTGIVQGMGLGFVFVPLSTITFATLAPHYRTEATAMFSLMRNIGSSIGISIMVTLVARNTQINHATLGEFINPFRPAFDAFSLPGGIEKQSTTGLAMLNQMVTEQAATIGYLNDFRLMAWITLASIPLLLLFRSNKRTASQG
ncbi:DHA2 family efflux MFS transporter permease subunit [Marinobacter nanhaiticus D15-8W]|uniref:DHA2 family efflux MFS transporter permease subunit n=1 Tax=Marinobacter nanhaiticus D15-8W TaxID=626887 RepID=N6X5C8_9GAMM|nr:DHA2 family efflux MFS transporter permease subunit [Marinobacter nanhaiticus]ENO16278.2 DHA2 family efflux MFS transporter permease subunit [Marinobacter nanhaiticus D15-8W]BES72865.1 DHA2 family efflux MFS transporter permease subunit [Marinobacter nanhaiticus D15-8W]